jgi:hypothetical protein
MARVGEDTPGFFGPGGAGLFSFFGNEPTGYEALLHRRKIAEALAAQKKGMPKNVGEGLTYLGESIGEAGLNWRLRQAEAEQAKQEAGISGGVPRTGGYQTDTSAPVVTTAPRAAAPAPRAAIEPDPAVTETTAAAETGTEAPATRLSYAPEAPRDLPPEETAAPAVDPTAVSRPPASILPMQDQRPPVAWTDLAVGAKPGRPMEGVAMRTVPDPGNAQLRASPSPEAFFDNAPSMPMEPGWEGTPRLGGEPSSPTAGTFASRYDAMPGAASQVALTDVPADTPQVAAADVPLPRPRPEMPAPVAQTGGPTFRTERNAEVGSRIGFDRAVKGIHPELQARLQAAYNDMPEDVRKSFVLNEGARTKEYQQYLYDTRSGRGMVARPGHSRHEQGEAVDVDRGPALDWLQKNGSQYGLGGIKGDYPHIQMARGGRQFFDPANPVALNAPGGSNVAVANGGYNAIDAAAAPVQVANTPREAVTNAMSIVQARDAPPSPTDAAQVARTQDVLGMGSQARLPATASLGRNDVASDAPPLGVNPVSPAIDAGVAEATQQRNAIAKEILNQQQKIPVPEEPATGPTQAGTEASPSPTTTGSNSAATTAATSTLPKVAETAPAPSGRVTDIPVAPSWFNQPSLQPFPKAPAPAEARPPSQDPIPPLPDEEMAHPGDPPPRPKPLGLSPIQKYWQPYIDNPNVSPALRKRAEREYGTEEIFRKSLESAQQNDYVDQRERYQKKIDEYDKFQREKPARQLDAQIKRSTLEEFQAKAERRPVDLAKAQADLEESRLKVEEMYYKRGIPREQARQQADLAIAEARRKVTAPTEHVIGGAVYQSQPDPVTGKQGSYALAPGSPQPEDKPLTEQQANAKMFVDRVKDDVAEITTKYKNGKALTYFRDGMLASRLPFGLDNKAVSDEYRHLNQAYDNFAAAFMKQVSGAAYGEKEAARNMSGIRPAYGDNDDDLAAKARRMRTFVDSAAQLSGKGGEEMVLKMNYDYEQGRPPVKITDPKQIEDLSPGRRLILPDGNPGVVPAAKPKGKR